MAEENPKTECDQCGQETDRPYDWRQRSFCSAACMNEAIEEVNAEVAKIAQAAPLAPVVAEAPKPKGKKGRRAAQHAAEAETK